MGSTLLPLPDPRSRDERLLYFGGLGALLGDLALVVGLLVVSMAGVTRLEYQINDPVPLVPFAVYAFLGCAAVGSAVAIFAESSRTRSPVLVAVIVYVAAVAHTWWAAPHGAGVVTAVEYVLVAWPFVAVVALLAGMLERSARTSG